MATGQTASDRIVCLHRRGNKDQGESELGQRDLPSCNPRPYHQGEEDHPYSGIRTRISNPRYTFPVLLAATAHKLTEQRVVGPISTARLSRKKNVFGTSINVKLLDCTNSASKLLLQPKALDMLINVDF